MYLLRDDATTQTLRLELSGEVTSAEAARATSQTFTLALAGNRSRVVCDLTDVQSGPDDFETLAALLHSHSVNFRLAFVGHSAQLAAAVRLAELAGIELLTGAFTNTADADAWLLRPASEGLHGLPETARRHLMHQRAEAQPRTRPAKRVEPAA